MSIHVEDVKKKKNIDRKKKNEMQEFISFHFPKHETADGSIFVKKPKAFTTKDKDGCPFTVNYMQIVGVDRISNLDDFAKKIVWHKKNDYYITANSFSGCSTKNEGLFSFLNIVLDFDLHRSVFGLDTVLDRVNRLKKFIEEEWNPNHTPKINTFVYTGRGAQLWISTISFSYKFFDVYSKVVSKICSEFRKCIKNDPYLRDFIVDTAATNKPAGLFRMPGTFNNAAQVWTYFERLSDERLDMIDYCRTYCWKKKENNTMMKGTKVCPYGINRVNFYMDLVKIRSRQEDSGNENRDLHIFYLYSACRYKDLMSHDEAMEYVYRMNSMFLHPLSEEKILEYLSTSIRKDGYILPWEKAIDVLDIQEEEIAEVLSLGHVRMTDHWEKEYKFKHLSEEQKKQAIKLNKKGVKLIDIAAEIGVSPGAISSLFSKNGIKSECKNRRIRIYELLDQGASLRDIQAKENIAYRTASRYRKEWREEKEQKEKKEKVQEDIEEKFQFREKEIFQLTPEIKKNAMAEIKPIIELQDFLFLLYQEGLYKPDVVSLAIEVLEDENFEKVPTSIRIDIPALKKKLEHYIQQHPKETILRLIHRNAEKINRLAYDYHCKYLIESIKEHLTVNPVSGGIKKMTEEATAFVNRIRKEIHLTDRSVAYCIGRAVKCMWNRVKGKQERRAKKRFESLHFEEHLCAI